MKIISEQGKRDKTKENVRTFIKFREELIKYVTKFQEHLSWKNKEL